MMRLKRSCANLAPHIDTARLSMRTGESGEVAGNSQCLVVCETAAFDMIEDK